MLMVPVNLLESVPPEIKTINMDITVLGER